MGGHLLVGLGVGEGEVELGNLQGEREEVGEEEEEQWHLQGEREEVGEGEEQVLGRGVEL